MTFIIYREFGQNLTSKFNGDFNNKNLDSYSYAYMVTLGLNENIFETK